MKEKRIFNVNIVFPCVVTALLTIWVMLATAMPAYAATSTVEIAGTVYEMDKSSKYVLSESTSASAASSENTLGTFSITGTLESDDSSDMPSFVVGDGVITLNYIYDVSSFNTNEEDWCLYDDSGKKVNDISLSSKIKSGAIILQTSLDGETWVTESIDNSTDIFSGNSEFENAFYTTYDIQLQNGCYYRVIVAYAMKAKVEESSFLIFNTDKYDYKKVVEVYEFYASYAESSAAVTDTHYSFPGETVRTSDSGYTGGTIPTTGDVHKGWDLGDFFVTGFTRKTVDTDGTTVFLKNVGDTVTLWFKLGQDITCLNGDSTLTISDDNDGYDEYFGISKTDFGKGTLIIQFTDEDGVKHDPIVYTNFLEACTRTGADTKVQLFEEGDYEIALDYEISSKTSILPASTTHYRISFSFSIRNGNCMVYPFDLTTGSELSDQSIAENGFKLDTANSKYLTIDVVRSVISVKGDGQLIEDIRFNRPAKDGEEFVEEGIYTFTVKNLYTGASTTKTIYVGTDKYYLAMSANTYSIDDLNELIAEGATVENDGTVVLPVVYEEEIIETIEDEEAVEVETEAEVEEEASADAEEILEDSETEAAETTDTALNYIIIAILAGAVVFVALVAAVIVSSKRKSEKHKIDP